MYGLFFTTSLKIINVSDVLESKLFFLKNATLNEVIDDVEMTDGKAYDSKHDVVMEFINSNDNEQVCGCKDDVVMEFINTDDDNDDDDDMASTIVGECQLYQDDDDVTDDGYVSDYSDIDDECLSQARLVIRDDANDENLISDNDDDDDAVRCECQLLRSYEKEVDQSQSAAEDIISQQQQTTCLPAATCDS